MKNLILQKESDHNVRQWHFSNVQVISFSVSILVILVSIIYLSADILSDYLYEKRLNEFKENYIKVADNLERNWWVFIRVK